MDTQKLLHAPLYRHQPGAGERLSVPDPLPRSRQAPEPGQARELFHERAHRGWGVTSELTLLCLLPPVGSQRQLQF